jgi:hypothetical protein
MATPANPDGLARIPFTARDEASIKALAKWMHVAAMFSVIGAALRVVGAFTPRYDASQIIGAVITFLIGLWTYQAASAFGQVAATDTSDQRSLMHAFGLLRRVFLLQAILVIIVLALLVVMLMGAAVFLMARH